MQSKNKKSPTVAESAHIVRIKEMVCSVCDEAGPSDCHEINQGQWFSSIPLCKSCHQGPLNGLHGQRQMWKLKKIDEIGALAITIERLMT